ncbi:MULTISPECIES: hypothetical protein [unclassified Frondihabitans]|uniref:hypothetical protein n=1 Tax=unclassified Frondihabitans TaxID=2626248 RepID=UPI000F50B538|nr:MULTISPECIES: hypothetical protein [unclassified Frondihabitans]RPE75138.1 hypothetical protein EDF37_2737 [Frondihabitans sp. PhB153]RPF04380.1 hypothetical protein EDF39_2805 [Frondihabitans sp. PhB161]
MSLSSSSRFARINIPRMVLWLVSLVVAAGGYLLMTQSNAKEAAVYASGTADYPKLFAAQSGSTVGGLLIAAGVIGALLALTSMSITWRAAQAREIPASTTHSYDLEDLELEREDESDAIDESDAKDTTGTTAIGEAPATSPR